MAKAIIFIILGLILEIGGMFTSIGGLVVLSQSGMNIALVIGPVAVICGLVSMVYGILDFIPDSLLYDFKSFFSKD